MEVIVLFFGEDVFFSKVIGDDNSVDRILLVKKGHELLVDGYNIASDQNIICTPLPDKL